MSRYGGTKRVVTMPAVSASIQWDRATPRTIAEANRHDHPFHLTCKARHVPTNGAAVRSIVGALRKLRTSSNLLC